MADELPNFEGDAGRGIEATAVVLSDADGNLAASTAPAGDYIVVTPSSDPLADGPCRSIRCSEDGVLDLTTVGNEVRVNIPVFKGDNPLRASVIDEPTTGSAPAVVVALY